MFTLNYSVTLSGVLHIIEYSLNCFPPKISQLFKTLYYLNYLKFHFVEISNADHRYILNKFIFNVTRLTKSTVNTKIWYIF